MNFHVIKLTVTTKVEFITIEREFKIELIFIRLPARLIEVARRNETKWNFNLTQHFQTMQYTIQSMF